MDFWVQVIGGSTAHTPILLSLEKEEDLEQHIIKQLITEAKMLVILFAPVSPGQITVVPIREALELGPIRTEPNSPIIAYMQMEGMPSHSLASLLRMSKHLQIRFSPLGRLVDLTIAAIVDNHFLRFPADPGVFGLVKRQISMFLRPSYLILEEMIEAGVPFQRPLIIPRAYDEETWQFISSKCSFFVTGNPGIGKSCFLLSYLFSLLKRGISRPILLFSSLFPGFFQLGINLLFSWTTKQ